MAQRALEAEGKSPRTEENYTLGVVQLAEHLRSLGRDDDVNPDGIITAQLTGTAGRHVSRKPLNVDAALAELREIADGRGDLLAERAGVTLGFYARENRDEWQRKALEAALCIAAGADLTRLVKWIVVGQERAEGVR